MRNDIVEQAKKIRADMNTVISNLTDEEAVKVKGLYLPWEVGIKYSVDDVRRYGDKLYRCLQAHTSQADWTPDAVPALWVEVAAPGEYREIKDNMLSTEAFAKGEIGWYQTKDNLWKSIIDANVWTPDSYPAGWEKYTE